MRSDKAVLCYCPFVARKCQGEKCLGWTTSTFNGEKFVDGEGYCIYLEKEHYQISLNLDKSAREPNTPNP